MLIVSMVACSEENRRDVMVVSVTFERGQTELRLSDEHPDRAIIFFRGLGGAEAAVSVRDADFPFVGRYLKEEVYRLLDLDSD